MYMLDTLCTATTLEDIIQNFHDPFVVYNAEQEVLLANTSFYQLIAQDVKKDKHIFKKFFATFHCFDFKGKKLSGADCPIFSILQGKSVQNGELQLIHKFTKESIYFYVSTSPIPVQREDEDLFLVMMRDVTNTIAQTETRREFIQIAAHELRSPITSIKGFTQLIYERYKERNESWYFRSTLDIIKDLERDEKFLEIMLDEVYRLDELTDELLSIFKLDQGRLELEKEKVDIVSFVEQALTQYHLSTDFHHIQFERRTSHKYVYIDKKQICRVLLNFLSNAIKYSPDSPNIYVWVEVQEQDVLVAVRDEGLGIPVESQARIFERFYRVEDPLHEGIPGYGIGLHICCEIIRLHGGDIFFESSVGVGSTFYFRLPLAK